MQSCFDMTVLNDLDRFHLVMDTIDRLPQTRDQGIYLKQQLRDKLIEHKQYYRQIRRGPAGNPPLEVGRDQRRQTGVTRAGAREDVHYANDPQ
jgi:hypothetical protein